MLYFERFRQQNLNQDPGEYSWCHILVSYSRDLVVSIRSGVIQRKIIEAGHLSLAVSAVDSVVLLGGQVDAAAGKGKTASHDIVSIGLMITMIILILRRAAEEPCLS
jgi:hypothetical protein